MLRPLKRIRTLKRTTSALLSVLLFSLILMFQSCRKEPQTSDSDFSYTLSEYKIFKGIPSNLEPSEDMILYELATPLFSDYSEKQRLIRLPVGEKMKPMGDGLPEFPEGTLIAKTFYYYHDQRDVLKGKKILETRLLLKQNNQWKVATYLWNDEQTEAYLYTSGMDKMVNWIDATGKGKVVVYHFPSNKECGICHQSDQQLTPIGPKLRNLNREVERNAILQNQLTWLQNEQKLHAVNPASITALPDWRNSIYSVNERARAYLEVNCAHCHTKKGFAPNENFYPAYEETEENSKIIQRKNQIVQQMQSGQMPKAGTTVVHEEALELIRSYVNSL